MMFLSIDIALLDTACHSQTEIPLQAFHYDSSKNIAIKSLNDETEDRLTAIILLDKQLLDCQLYQSTCLWNYFLPRDAL